MKSLEQSKSDVTAVLEKSKFDVTAVQGCVEGVLRVQSREEKEEEEEKNKRKSNIILYGLPEPTATQSEDRKKEDSDLTQELFHALSCDDITVNHMTRLGPPKTESNQNPKPRPVKLDLASEEARNVLLKKGKKLEEVPQQRKVEEYIHTPGPHPERKRDTPSLGTRTENEKISWRRKLDHCKQQDRFHLLEARSDCTSHSTDKRNLAGTEVYGQLKCICFNAQSLRHKMSELFVLAEVKDPHIIGVTESWGFDGISDAEFSIPGFTMFRVDRKTGHRGGGVLLYVKNEMKAVQVDFKSKFTDQVWCKIRTVNDSELLTGVCYRSPNVALSATDNDSLLYDLITEVSGKPLLLMGDFNYPDIDWSTGCGHTGNSQNFADCIEDCFLTQHVTESTRKGSILDLVITSEPNMIDVVSVLGTFGSSDHNMLEWNVNYNPKVYYSERSCPDYSRANFTAIRQALIAVD